VVVLKLLSFGLAQQGFGLWMSFFMLFFIYKFCQLKWWCSNQLVVWILHYYKLHQLLVSRKLPLVTLLSLRSCLILENHNHQWKVWNVIPSFSCKP
jgi:hypothetical protein